MFNLVANGPSGYNLTNSLRFRSSASAYLSRTPASATNQTTWTYSVWVKRGNLTTGQSILSAHNATNFCNLYFDSTTNNFTYDFDATPSQIRYGGNLPNALRDPSAWYHIVVTFDSTQATAANRIKAYINGVQYAFNTITFPQNTVMPINSNTTHNIGRRSTASDNYLDGYLTEVNFIDGQALTPSSFGSTNATTGVWQPARYTGTYGTNGFYLKFSNIALTSGSNTGLGQDYSGNGNYWNTNNISVTAGTTYDAMTDVPTLTSATVANYPVISPLTGVTPTGGNLNLSGGDVAGLGTMAFPSTGKWYFEMVCGSGVTTTSLDSIGIGTTDINGTLPANKSVYMYRSNGNKLSIINGGASSQVAYGATFVNGDVIGAAFDCDADTLTFYKNNVSQGTAFTSILSSTPSTPFFLTVYARGFGGTSNVSLNAGQRPFAYTPPTGYVALNTYNLPTSTIVQGNKYMDATTYTGTGSATQTITNAAGFKPDFVWVKSRSAAFHHGLFDAVRGVGSGNTTDRLVSNATWAQDGGPYMQSLNSNGFTITNYNATYTENGTTYVGWQWQAGQGTTSSNTSGSITSTVSVNASAGFSVVTWTAVADNSTIGHGLGVTPAFIITKSRSNVINWVCYHKSLGANGYIQLNLTNAAGTASGFWGTPNSTTFGVSANGNANNSGNMVAYCWAEIAGFSKFGSYTGNGSTDGTFVYTGFRPKYVLIKRTDTGGFAWEVYDNARNLYNSDNNVLYPNLSDAEASYSSGQGIDSLSNGFKLRASGGGTNASGGTYIYAAFAENPFKNALAR